MAKNLVNGYKNTIPDCEKKNFFDFQITNLFLTSRIFFCAKKQKNIKAHKIVSKTFLLGFRMRPNTGLPKLLNALGCWGGIYFLIVILFCKRK